MAPLRDRLLLQLAVTFSVGSFEVARATLLLSLMLLLLPLLPPLPLLTIPGAGIKIGIVFDKD